MENFNNSTDKLPEHRFILTFIYRDESFGKKILHIREVSKEKATKTFLRLFPNLGDGELRCRKLREGTESAWKFNGFRDPPDNHEMLKARNRLDIPSQPTNYVFRRGRLTAEFKK